MLGQIRSAGHEVSSDPDAEAIIVNTCGFIDAAKEESVNAILEVAERKRAGRVRRLIVAGCLVQRYKEELRASIPEIDGFIPLSAIGEAVRLLEAPDRSVAVTGDVALYDGLQPRILSTPPHLAYVKIAEGCDNPCTFCPIPSFKGPLHSRGQEDILRELADLQAHGVQEAVLIAQDTTDFGRDHARPDGLSDLVEALETRPTPRWVRLLYTYPNHLTPRLLAALGRSSKVVPYLDLPLQHADPSILKAMGRGGSGEAFLRLLDRAREAVPGLALRSTFIVGFPGEGREHFRALLDFVRRAELDHAGAFTYSREEGTAAHALGDPVDPRTKVRRKERLLALQQEVSLARNRARVGSRLRVLVEGVHEETEHLLQGRAAHQAPEVDGHVLINDGFAAPGTFAQVKITEAHPYDLVGEILG
jgi:ribosomal protein S12 methylthiotransferase